MAFIYLGIGLYKGEVFAKDNRELIFTHLSYIFLILAFAFWKLTDDARPIIKSTGVRTVLDEGLILVTDVNWMSVNIGVSIFIEEAGFERFVANGQIITIQTNGLVQIAIASENTESAIQKIKERRDSVLIKPGVTI